MPPAPPASFVLYKWRAGYGLPSIDPASTQAEVRGRGAGTALNRRARAGDATIPRPHSPLSSPQVYLRLADVPLVVQECTGARSAPTGERRAMGQRAAGGPAPGRRRPAIAAMVDRGGGSDWGANRPPLPPKA
mgnify:CR=1|jgi:hypothetical protein